MRHQTGTFLQKFIDTHGISGKVLDVGSADITGNIRPYLTSVEYVGVDMRPDTNVDVVLNAHDLVSHFGKDSFDVVMSFDMLEHDDRFWESVSQMREVLKPGGWFLLGVPGRHCPPHDHPGDYWRFMRQSMNDFFFAGYEEVHIEAQSDDPSRTEEDEFYGWGRKPKEVHD